MKRKRIYPNLKAWRDAHGFTQEEAARALGISQGYYSKLEQQEEFAGKRLGKVISGRASIPLETVLGLS